MGRIVDTAVAGLSYSTATQSGVTGRDGSFRYLTGETIRFAIGGIQLASIPAQATINWFELGGMTTIPVGNEQIDALASDTVDADGDGIYNGPSLSRVGAIAAVLTTLDEDRNSANGIVIQADVAARMDDRINLTFDYVSEPRYNASFKRALRQLAADGLLPAREPRHGALELAALYERLGVASDYKVPTRFVQDGNGDGIADGTNSLTHDSATGRVLRNEYDSNSDGLVDDIYTYAYTEEMNSDLSTTDLGNDGIDNANDWDYDAFGDLVRLESTRNGSLEQLETRELDPTTGLYLRREVINPTSNVHTIETWTMDNDGNRPSATIDFDGDGTPERYVTMRYDAPNTLWTYREDDFEGDGVPEVITTRRFNSDGLQLELRRDDDADGTFDSVQQTTYDAAGRRIRETTDADNDGTPETISEWERDARGLILSSRRVQNDTVTYADVATYNADGYRLSYEVDRDGDGTFDDAYFTSYDANNNVTEFRTDQGADGVLDSIATRIYDADGRQIEQRYDAGADGTIESSTVYVYNADGLMTRREDYRVGVLSSVYTYENFVSIPVSGYF